MFGQLQVLNGDFPPFLQIPVKQHFVQVSVLWQAGPPWGGQGGWLGVGSTLGVFQTKGEWGGMGPGRKTWHECRPPHPHGCGKGRGIS